MSKNDKDILKVIAALVVILIGAPLTFVTAVTLLEMLINNIW